MRTPPYDFKVFKDRRARLAKIAPPGSAILLHAHPEYIRNDDVHHSYRPDTNLFYLTGWSEPESILLIRPGQTPETVLFVRPKDAARETWDGFRYGPEAAKSEFYLDQTHLISDFNSMSVDLLKPCERIYCRLGIEPMRDLELIALLDKIRLAHGRSGRGLLPLHDAKELMGELRVIKDADDISFMREACEISAQGHRAAMRSVKPGMNERQVMGNILQSFYQQGAAREGYDAIVAAGRNATTLHYRFNDEPCRDGDLLLIDAGAETIHGYTGDITRTFPINGKFSEPQRKVYESVLRVQKKLITMAKPGEKFKTLVEYAIDALTDEMISLGLLKGARKDLVESAAFRKYYPHGMGHFLGMDVHDAGLYSVGGEPRVLEKGIAFTIEPGIYIPADDTDAPKELRGIGVRIEDDVVITDSGVEVLTASAPKEVEELEALVGRG